MKTKRQERLLSAAAIALLLQSCHPIALTPRGAAVRLIKGDPPEVCREVGPVSAGIQVGGCDVACQQTRMRNQAGDLGGDTLRVDAYLGAHNNAAGTVFLCRSDRASGGGAATDADAQVIRILVNDPPSDCEEAGAVSVGVRLGGCDIPCQQAEMKKQAAALGANTIRVDAYLGKNNNAAGTAFRCPTQRAAH